jgi:hypothetical protein
MEYTRTTLNSTKGLCTEQSGANNKYVRGIFEPGSYCNQEVHETLQTGIEWNTETREISKCCNKAVHTAEYCTRKYMEYCS